MAPTTTSRAAISRAHELSLSNDGYNAIGALPHTGPPNSLLASKKSGEPYTHTLYILFERTVLRFYPTNLSSKTEGAAMAVHYPSDALRA